MSSHQSIGLEPLSRWLHMVDSVPEQFYQSHLVCKVRAFREILERSGVNSDGLVVECRNKAVSNTASWTSLTLVVNWRTETAVTHSLTARGAHVIINWEEGGGRGRGQINSSSSNQPSLPPR